MNCADTSLLRGFFEYWFHILCYELCNFSLSPQKLSLLPFTENQSLVCGVGKYCSPDWALCDMMIGIFDLRKMGLISSITFHRKHFLYFQGLSTSSWLIWDGSLLLKIQSCTLASWWTPCDCFHEPLQTLLMIALGEGQVIPYGKHMFLFTHLNQACKI